jgi:lipoate-protein ligase A
MNYYVNQSRDPYYNQAFEEYLFEHAPEEDILLLWRNGPAVVCGCYQNPFAEVSVPAALKAGVAIVRRPTGGGAVYHDPGNVNYTRIAPQLDSGADYGRFIRPVVGALNRLGIPAAFTRTCDISVDGLKVSGSAQKIAGGRVLHHGTLLYDTDLTALRALANGRLAHYESRGIASVPWPVANMKRYASLDADSFEQALLAELLGPDGVKCELTPEQLAEVRALADEKYRNWNWTFGKTPAFSYRRDFTWQGREMSVQYEARKGAVVSAKLPEGYERMEQALVGLELRPELLQAVCGSMWEYFL